eukprot:gene3484-2184_t
MFAKSVQAHTVGQWSVATPVGAPVEPLWDPCGPPTGAPQGLTGVPCGPLWDPCGSHKGSNCSHKEQASQSRHQQLCHRLHAVHICLIPTFFQLCRFWRASSVSPDARGSEPIEDIFGIGVELDESPGEGFDESYSRCGLGDMSENT